MFCHVFVDHFHIAICVLRDSSFRLVSFTLYIIDFFIEIYNLHSGPWERFLPRGGPNNKENKILSILKIFTI